LLHRVHLIKLEQFIILSNSIPMTLKCPSCGVINPPRARACAFCKYDFAIDQPISTPVSMAQTVAAPANAASIETPSSNAPLVLEAPFMRIRGIIGTLIMGLMLLPMMFITLTKAPTYPLILLFAWILVALFIPQVLLLIRPRRLVVEGERFTARGIPAVNTLLANIYLVAHDGVGLCMKFHSLEQVDCTAKWRQLMENNAIKHGYHLIFHGFTFDQAETLRKKAGLPEQGINASLSHVRSYQQTIRQLTPHIIVTYVLVALNCLVYLLMVITDVDWLNPSLTELLNWGADFGPYTTNGQSWRLLTCCFVHIGLFHLIFNMWAFLSVGPMMERLLGQTGFLLVYLSSGLFGSIVSTLWNPLVVGAGASGAIFGIFGAMLGFLVLHRYSMPVNIYRNVWRSGVAFLVFNLLFASGMPGIDVAAHLGGAIAGFFSGMVLSQTLDEHTQRRRFWRNLLLAGMAALLLGPAFFFLPAAIGPQADWTTAMVEYEDGEKKIFDRYNRLQSRVVAGEVTDQEMQNTISKIILPEWSAWQKRITALAPLKPRDVSFQRSLLNFMELQREGWEQVVEALDKQDMQLMMKANEKLAEAQKVVERMNSIK
jgi:rhomboid protease GluP